MSEDEEEDLSEEVEETNIAKNYCKLNTFPTFQNSPFVCQKPIVQKFNTVNFKTQQSIAPELLMTRRELPVIQEDVRGKLKIKNKMLEGLYTNRIKRDY